MKINSQTGYQQDSTNQKLSFEFQKVPGGGFMVEQTMKTSRQPVQTHQKPIMRRVEVQQIGRR